MCNGLAGSTPCVSSGQPLHTLHRQCWKRFVATVLLALVVVVVVVVVVVAVVVVMVGLPQGLGLNQQKRRESAARARCVNCPRHPCRSLAAVR